MPHPTLHLLCGKIASGKSTLAAKLADAEGTVLIAEDTWLATLYPNEMATPQDYLRCAAQLKEAMGPHIALLLKNGVSVVLDFQANTVESRGWMRGIIDQTRTEHQLHVLTPPDELCLERLRERNAKGIHPFTVSEEQFHRFARHFSPPTPEEGFNLVSHNDPTRDGL
ncbi:MAG: ATP-binding protein [Pseudomonadota bacterium]